MSKKVLIAVSEHGFWAEELLKPLDRLKAAGIDHDFLVVTGKTLPFPDPACLDSDYVDPPLGRPVTSPAMAERTKCTDWQALFQKRVALESWMPVRPYLSVGDQYLEKLEEYYVARAKAWERLNAYDGLLMVGGGGAVVDLVNSNRLHDVILGFYYASKPIAAECYTVTCLAFARELDTRKSIVDGKHVTGHTIEYDYTANWAVVANPQGDFLTFGSPPFPLEYILRDAVGPTGQFHGNVGRKTSVIADYPFVTSRSVACSDELGQTFVRVLGEDLRRYGW
jgi:putative intracellular protease/amidase